MSVQFVAIHLPQFHPIPENDEWWGKGFTEWTNVTRARPLFRHHWQPQLPADLGYYDLRLPEARYAQAKIAAEHGVDAFCYYHYWFHGRRVLERPVDEILSSGEPKFPFFLCWANETWQGRWHGLTAHNRTLIAQDYSPADDLDHIRALIPFFADSRYFRIEGRPAFVFYRPFGLPDCKATLDLWREEACRHGLPDPFFIASDSHADGRDPRDVGFDAILQFLPQLDIYNLYARQTAARRLRRFVSNIKHKTLSHDLRIYDYERSVREMWQFTRWPALRSIMPGWDNSPRSGRRGVILTDSTPDVFERLLREVTSRTLREQPESRRIVFINAWNEWAEGNHLEPDQKFGRGYLEAVSRVKNWALTA